MAVESAQSTITPEIPDIFKTFARSLYPKSMKDVFRWSNELSMHQGLYSQALKKACRYFLTQIEVTGIGDKELSFNNRQSYEQALTSNFDIMGELALIGDDFLNWGNVFITLYYPFERALICPVCGSLYPIREMRGRYRYEQAQFKGRCLNERCNVETVFQVKDTRLPLSSRKPVITRWPPQYMDIVWNAQTGRKRISMNILEYRALVDPVRRNEPFVLEDTNIEILEAISLGKKLHFNDDEIFHMSDNSSAYLNPILMGWGLPKFMNEFETVVLITMLDRYDEAILMDYLVPFRVFSPQPSTSAPMPGGAMDQILMGNLGNFAGMIQSMIQRHRINPTDWNFCPVPLTYQVFGGEAKNLAPVEIMKYYEMRLLNAIGVPQEFYTSSISNTAAPIIGFRMFERTWQHFGQQLNSFLDWLTRQFGAKNQWEPATAKLIPVSIYEDPEVKRIVLDMMAAGEVSKTTGFRTLGLSRRQERKYIFDEQEEDAREQERIQKQENDRQSNLMFLQNGPQDPNAQPPGAPGSPMPVPGPVAGNGTGQPQTINDLMLQSQQLAQQLWTMDPYTRNKQLESLRKSNDAVYGMTKTYLERMRNDAGTQGVQASQAGQAPPPPPR